MAIKWIETSLFDTEPAVARGPVQSQMTVDSLGKDTSLKFQIAAAVVVLSARHTIYPFSDSSDLVVTYDTPVTDDHITEYLEGRYNRRFQRNVVARTRGLMERSGWFEAVPDVIGRTGRPTHAIIPTFLTVKTVRDGGN